MGIKRFVRRFACLALLGLIPAKTLALDAFLHSERIYEGDVATLVLQYVNDIPSLYALDTTPLERDFEVIDAQSRVHRISDPEKPALRMEWIVQIAPLESGRIEIPPLRLGDHISETLWLDVEPRPPDELRKTDVTMEMEVAPENPHVGQQVIVTMRLLSNVVLNNGRLSWPETGQGRVYRNRIDRHYSISRGGQQYHVLERSLSLFVDRTGLFRLNPAAFRGRLLDDPNRQLLRRSEPIEMNVRPKPGEFNQKTWLPATSLTINQDWDSQNRTLEVGQSLGFTLNIEAHGLSAESLPVDLASRDEPGYRIYPDEAITSNEFDRASIVGRIRQSFVFVASKPGIIDVPGISLHWWDTDNHSLRTVTLAGRQFDVIEPALAANDSLGRDHEISEFEADRNADMFFWAGVVVIVLLGLFIPVGRQSLASRLVSRIKRTRTIRACEVNFKQACLANDPGIARDRLIQLARQCWPDDNFYGLRAITDKLDNDRFIAQIAILDEALFGRTVGTWEGRSLWQAFVACKQGRVTAREAQSTSLLPRLYPAGFRRRPSPSP